MAEFSDPPPSNLSSSHKLTKPNQTLDESSPTAPIRDLVTNSLSLSSPIRQIQALSPAKPDGSSSSPPDKTLNFNPEENRDVNPDESSSSPSDKTLIAPPAQISPVSNNNHLRITNTSDSYLYRPPRRYIEYESDDDELNKMEPTKPLQLSWWYPRIEPTGVVSFSSSLFI
jgi:ubiquitin carboxyl-terminal hydrolase 36/42